MLVDCPEAELGALDKGLDVPGEKVRKEGVIVHGILVPHYVATQLREIQSLASYSRDQLQAAIWAAAADGRVFDDPNGTDFYDRLHLDPNEVHGNKEHSFCDALKNERKDDSAHSSSHEYFQTY